MMKRFIFSRVLPALIALGIAVCAAAQQHDANVQKAAKVLGINLDSVANSCKPGMAIIRNKGQNLMVRVNKTGLVEHIGIPLFSAAIRVLQPSPIYDYLEYAVLDHKYHVSENDLLLRQLRFKTGNWQTLETVGDSLQCVVSNVEDKFYEVTWRHNDQEVVSVNFPINYELLANSNRKAILEKFVAALREFRADELFCLPVDTTNLEPYKDGGILVHKGESYTVASINSNTYFRQEDGKTVWLSDKKHPAETLANRLLSPGSFRGDPTMSITCFLYNHRKEVVRTTLNNWLTFCRNNGCKPYYGFESNSQGSIIATLFMRNRESGYDHIVTVECSQDSLDDEHLQIEATAYLYAPSSNVSDLFYETSKPSQKKKIVLK